MNIVQLNESEGRSFCANFTLGFSGIEHSDDRVRA